MVNQLEACVGGVPTAQLIMTERLVMKTRLLLLPVSLLISTVITAQVEFQINWMYQVPDSLNEVVQAKLDSRDPRHDWAWTFDDVYFNEFPYLAQPVQLMIDGAIATPRVQSVVIRHDIEREELVESYKFINGEEMVIGRYPIWFMMEDQHLLFGLADGSDLIYVRPEDDMCKIIIDDGWSDRCAAQLILFNRFGEIEFLSKEELGHLKVSGWE